MLLVCQRKGTKAGKNWYKELKCCMEGSGLERKGGGGKKGLVTPGECGGEKNQWSGLAGAGGCFSSQRWPQLNIRWVTNLWPAVAAGSV